MPLLKLRPSFSVVVVVVVVLVVFILVAAIAIVRLEPVKLWQSACKKRRDSPFREYSVAGVKVGP